MKKFLAIVLTLMLLVCSAATALADKYDINTAKSSVVRIVTYFTVTDEKMHGVSMFVPQDPTKGNYAKWNVDIKRTAWWKAVN